MTVQEQYDQLNTAIGAIENGAQEYRVGNRTLRRADISMLYSERRRIQQELAAAENSGGTYVAEFYRG
ncbi:MAG: peptidylprolyl isomerase [Negativicutes bacterium]